MELKINRRTQIVLGNETLNVNDLMHVNSNNIKLWEKTVMKTSYRPMIAAYYQGPLSNLHKQYKSCVN